jgi:hypothetical protein
MEVTMRFVQHVQHALVLALISAPGYAQTPTVEENSALRIVVREGDRATNALDGRTAVRPVIELRDGNNGPASNARITFVLPEAEPGATFASGHKSISAMTGPDGVATAAEMHPLGIGTFEIRIWAEYQGDTATATVTQTNVASLAPEHGSFRIQILEGDDGVNIIDKKTAVKTVVRIVDKNNLPVAGVAVTFAVVMAKTRGPRVEFPGGKESITVETNSEGLAEAPASTPEVSGSLKIRISASYLGQTVATTITQTNFVDESAALREGKTPGNSQARTQESPTNVASRSTKMAGMSVKTILAIAGAVAGGVAAAMVAGNGGGGGGTGSGTSGIPIQIGGPGTPTIGPPR